MEKPFEPGNAASGTRKSLIRDLTLTLVLTVVFVTVVSIGMNSMFISQKARSDYARETRMLQDSIQESLELPLWNFDHQGTRKIAGIYLDNASIEYIAVHDQAGLVLFEGGKRPADTGRIHDLAITYSGEPVGGVLLAFHIAPYRQSILQLLFGQILTGILVVIALVFTIVLATKKNIKRPLGLLLENIGRIASGDYGITRESFEHREINAIQDEFSAMAAIIQTREQELIESGKRYRSLYDNVPVGLFRAAADGHILTVNSTALEMFGFTNSSELIETSLDTLCVDPSDRLSSLQQVQGPSVESPEEIRFRRKNGEVFWAKFQARQVMEADGRGPYLDGFLLDITQRKTAELTLKDREEKLTRINRNLNVEIIKRKATEQALRSSERRMAQIINFLPDPTFAIDNDGRVIFWNRALEKLTGVRSETMVGKGNYEYSLLFYKKRRPLLIDLVREWDETVAASYIYVTQKDGILISESRDVPFVKGESWFWNAACPLVDHHGKMIGAIETIRNITDLKRTEQELRETGNRFRTLFDSASDAILILDSGEIVDCNQKALEMYGYARKEMLGLSVWDLSPPKQPDGKSSREKALAFIQAVLAGPVDVFEWKHRKSSGFLFDTEVGLTTVELTSEVCIQAIVRDITERKRTRELMIQTEKMMSVGGLAAGMAHEINNPLGIILQSVQNTSRRLGTYLAKNRDVAAELGFDLDLMQEYLHVRSIDTYLDNIREAGERAAKIVRTMLDFSRKSESSKAMHSVNTILDQVLEMASNDYDLKKKYDFRSVEIVRDYGDVPEIICTETEIAQVFLNLVKNAAQAMALHGYTGDRPRILLKTRKTDTGITVIIEDNGPGFDDNQRKAAFEPFFTTKAPGEGTGLGLSVSYFIITTNHKGTLEVESSSGNGARFIINLPLEYAVSDF
ncbi:MAG: PAS domain S-box protein [Pseudomonadota bacterium]